MRQMRRLGQERRGKSRSARPEPTQGREKKYDLTSGPYAYDTASMDHAICIGVLDFIEDSRLVFSEVSGILRSNAVFVFTVADRGPAEDAEYTSLPSTQSEPVVMMYRRTTVEVHDLLNSFSFEPLKSVVFFAYMDAGMAMPNRLKAYVVKRTESAVRRTADESARA